MAKTRIYHWTAPARIAHWWHVVAILILGFTGYYIHAPFLEGGKEAMAWMRFSHFVAMYILIYGFIVRSIYMCIFTNIVPECSKIMPLPKNLKGAGDVLAYYLFLKDTHAEYGRYNPLQGMVYFLTGLLIVVMVFTGFALYDGWLGSYFLWVNTLLGGDEITRQVHYIGMWLFICMVIVHVYFVIRQTVLSEDRTLMSMVDGYKEVEE